ncbi:Hypothetical_protein [Hexamita inflata]|uniref:Hypothetical_protein n=1 Tax=Hexamita inflata TaxID=28002 RepID=A0AA86U719_9EUKA|nr:Hypothetical protein HINF_LOCUS31199 [Hexamita inflata]
MLFGKFGFILATQKLKLNLARRRDTVVRDMEIPRRAQYFSAMIRRVSNLWLWRYLTTRKSQLSQIFCHYYRHEKLLACLQLQSAQKWNKQFGDYIEGNKQCISWLQQFVILFLIFSSLCDALVL